MRCGPCSRRTPHSKLYGQVLDAASSFTTLMREPELQKKVLAGMNSSDTDVQRAAVRICFEHFLNDPATEPAVKAAFAGLDDSALKVLMQEAGNPQFLKASFGRIRRRGLPGPGLSEPRHWRLNT